MYMMKLRTVPNRGAPRGIHSEEKRGFDVGFICCDHYYVPTCKLCRSVG